MPKNNNLHKVLVIGSGPIVIGQAAEFDYAGTQACLALKEEGIEVVLVNSNPATIMTDKNIADKVYIEPLTLEFLAQVIRREKPDGVLATLGGQTGLNLAVELAKSGILDEVKVQFLGTDFASIEQAEDREKFRRLMQEIGQPTPLSAIVHSLEEGLSFVKEVGYPVVIRPAYTLGGTGGGIANNEGELKEIVNLGLEASPVKQVLLEMSVAGFKEIEYEVMRDGNDNVIVVCNMENIDPVGIHTGDSIVIAPSQTLSDREYQMLRSASLEIIRALNIKGGCNVQFALDPYSFKYYVIEVNPRVSRSSALASKATGYPIAKISTKIAIGYNLDEIKNPITLETYAAFEPALDYVVIKIPRFPFDKFPKAKRNLGTQMKATGEVMSIGRTFEEALQKAVRSLELNTDSLELGYLSRITNDELTMRLRVPDDERLFIIAEALRRKISIQEINQLTKIDYFYLRKLQGLIDDEEKIKKSLLTKEELLYFKQRGFTDRRIANLQGKDEDYIRVLRKENNVQPVYKMVDTCAGEFIAQTPYYYSTYEIEDEVKVSDKEKVLVIGSGPIRIGQGIEFDYATVHAVWAIKELGYEAIIINNNPETVSTDYSISDRLYFEPLFIEDVLNVLEKEKPLGVIVQFGGQTAINLARGLVEKGINILGTSYSSLDLAEDREKFEKVLHSLNIKQPPGRAVTSIEEAIRAIEQLGLPVLVRPSYVIGGRAMEIIYSEEELIKYITEAKKVNPDYPILIDRYMLGKEVEIDAISDGNQIFVPGIMEHIERAGIHSGDSIAVYPPQSLSTNLKNRLIEITKMIAKKLEIKGLINIQFVIFEDDVYVLEVNPRSSRTVPFLSKVTNIPIANIATKVILNKSLKELGFDEEYYREKELIAVKVPVFSFTKLRSLEVNLGPEMKSTGEVMGIANSYAKALYKGFIASGMKIPKYGKVLVTLADKSKEEGLPLIKQLKELGFNVVATEGTFKFLNANGVKAEKINKITEESPNILDNIRNRNLVMVLNTLTKGKNPSRDGFRIRREAVEQGIPVFTSLDTFRAVLQVLNEIIMVPIIL